MSGKNKCKGNIGVNLICQVKTSEKETWGKLDMPGKKTSDKEIQNVKG